MSDTKKKQADALRELYENYSTVTEAITAIEDGSAKLRLYLPGGYIDLDEIFEEPNYLEKMRSDMVLYRWELRQALIEELANANKEEMGLADDDPDWSLDPIPLGTPKNDHRRHVAENDDGK